MIQDLKNQPWLSWVIFCLIVLPWINPYSAGPSPDVWPLLISALCALFICLLRRKLNVEIIVAALMCAGGISAMMGLLQYFLLADGLEPWLSQPQAGIAFGNIRQRNQFATLMSIGLVAMITWHAMQKIGEDRPWWMKYLALLLAFGNAASSSRTGLLQWLLIMILVTWWAQPNSKRRLVGFVIPIMGIYFLAMLSLPWLLEALTGVTTGGMWGRLGEVTDCNSRKVLWSNVLTLISQKPLLGWGWNDLKFAHFVTHFPAGRFCAMMGNAHNLPLHIAVTLGIPTAILISTAFTWWVLRQKPWREAEPRRQFAWGVIAIILLHSMVEFPLWYGTFQIAFCLCVWILCKPENNPETVNESANTHFFRSWDFPAAVVSILIGCFIAWDYYRVSQLYLPPIQRNSFYRDNTLDKVRGSLFFMNHVRFAELATRTPTVLTAQQIHDMATLMLHFSPEPVVIEIYINSGRLLGRMDDVSTNIEHYRNAFPLAYKRWEKANLQFR